MIKEHNMLVSNMPVSQQPKDVGGTRKGANHRAGTKRSVSRLDDLKFDPIRELVEKYRKLEGELEYQEKVRSNEIVPLTATGKIRWYNPETHMGIYDKLLNTGEKLLRYYYGRVPETIHIEEKQAMPLVVNLTKEGDVYTIGSELFTEILDDENQEIY
jgi:hypothetical protein